MTRIKILEIYLVLGLFTAVVALLYVWTASPLGTSDRVGITMAISTVALVIVTGIYAWHTSKMAEEMRKQRYDALRPVIDIVTMEQPRDTIERGLYAENGKPPKDVPCKLRNVGVGPALELYSFEDVGGNPRRCDFDTLPVATGKEEWGYTREERLLVIQRNNQSALVVRYKDVYGNLFESIREFSVATLDIGPLKVCLLPKKEHNE